MSSAATITVISDSQKVEEVYENIAFKAHYRINKIPYAQLRYVDSSLSIGNSSMSDKAVFKPGNNIQVNIRYESDNSKEVTAFSGVIMQNRIDFNNSVGSELILELRHHAIDLTASRKSVVFSNKNDVEVFKEITAQYSQINFISKVEGKITYDQLIQFWCTDWDFMLSRAQANGWSFIVDGSSNLVLIDLNESTNAKPRTVFDLNAGSVIYSLDMGVDILNQSAAVSAKSWDVNKQENLFVEDNNGISFNSSLNQLKSVRAIDDYQLIHTGNLLESELNTWACAKKLQRDLSLINGRMRVPGMLDIDLSDSVEVANLGQYFDGQHIVHAIHHSLQRGQGFQTELSFGESSDGFIGLSGIQPPPASGLVPGVKGLQIGVVMGYEEISKKHDYQLLVKVKLPLFEEGKNEIWARLASIYAGEERGVVFRPEEGDEVVLGFLNEDPRYPLILGSMYSDKNRPPIEFDEKNETKAIVTKEKVQILLKENEKSIRLLGSKENSINIVSEGEESGIALKEQNKNDFTLNKNGQAIVSGSDVSIKASKSVFVNAKKMEVK